MHNTNIATKPLKTSAEGFFGLQIIKDSANTIRFMAIICTHGLNNR
jgi:hypothetical protein